jgi:hypothetical protein
MERRVITIRFESVRAANVFLAMAEGMEETRQDDSDPAATGFGRLIQEISGQRPDDGRAGFTVTMPKYHNLPTSSSVSVDLEQVAGDILNACLENSRPYQPHEADPLDVAYVPDAAKCIFAGDVVIQAHNEVRLDEATAAAIEMLLEAVEKLEPLPPELERAVNTLNALLENC